MKTRYQLKTSNDLLFDFQYDQFIKVEEPFYEELLIQDLEDLVLPLPIEIEDERYIIVSFTKINEVETTITNEFKGKKKPMMNNEDYIGDHECG